MFQSALQKTNYNLSYSLLNNVVKQVTCKSILKLSSKPPKILLKQEVNCVVRRPVLYCHLCKNNFHVMVINHCNNSAGYKEQSEGNNEITDPLGKTSENLKDFSENVIANDSLFSVNIKKNVLEPPSDIEDVDFIAPQMKPTFNLAAYADKSATLKHFIQLGVEIAKWDKHKDICLDIFNMNFEKDIKPHIFFIHKNLGVPIDELGKWLTVNPFVLNHSLENLQTRINYLQSKKFKKENISHIVTTAPKWINYSTTVIDKKLGEFQRKFKLLNKEVVQLATKDPKLILYSIENNFFLERNMKIMEGQLGFSFGDQKKLLTGAPRIYRTNAGSLIRRFDIVYNEMGLSHNTITKFPKILGMRENKLSERNKFLKFLGKNQYDSSKPGYVSPMNIAVGNDAEFCSNIAHSSIEVFNDFLKTL